MVIHLQTRWFIISNTTNLSFKSFSKQFSKFKVKILGLIPCCQFFKSQSLAKLFKSKSNFPPFQWIGAVMSLNEHLKPHVQAWLLSVSHNYCVTLVARGARPGSAGAVAGPPSISRKGLEIRQGRGERGRLRASFSQQTSGGEMQMKGLNSRWWPGAEASGAMFRDHNGNVSLFLHALFGNDRPPAYWSKCQIPP